MMKKLILLIFFTVILVGVTKACICVPQTLEERIENYHSIFTGHVVSVEDLFSDSTSTWPNRQKIVIEIERIFKGNQNKKMVIYSELSSCASYFEEGKIYLVFADHYITNDTKVNEDFVANNYKITTGKCYGTKEKESSESEIRKLEKHFD